MLFRREIEGEGGFSILKVGEEFLDEGQLADGILVASLGLLFTGGLSLLNGGGGRPSRVRG